jgi:hypothetical protein
MEENCIRRLVNIHGENYYLLIGDDFVSVTVPRENSPEQVRERTVADTLCRKITALMRLRRIINGRKQ